MHILGECLCSDAHVLLVRCASVLGLHSKLHNFMKLLICYRSNIQEGNNKFLRV